jgi:hypothetical protein
MVDLWNCVPTLNMVLSIWTRLKKEGGGCTLSEIQLRGRVLDELLDLVRGLSVNGSNPNDHGVFPEFFEPYAAELLGA